jgi:hypothetical protein
MGEKTMKTMKAFCTAIVLSLILSISAFAGDIAAPGAARTADPTVTILTNPPAPPANNNIGLGDLEASMLSDVLLTLLSMY